MSFQPTDIMRINNAHNVAGNTSANHNAGFDPNNMGGNSNAGQQQGHNPNDNVTDVDYEEVK